MSLSSQIRYAQALDSSATDGSGKTGLAFSDITAKYLVMGGTLTSLTTETITTLGTYQAPTDASHLRIKELAGSDPTKGIYEIHFHNTQVASTPGKLWLFLSATGARFQPIEIDLNDLSGRLPAALTANGNMKASFVELITTALTEGATGRLKAALTTLLDVATPVLTAACVNQTGDSYARIGSTGSGLTSLATSAQVTGLNVNTRANLTVPGQIETPDSSTQVYKVRLSLYNVEGGMEAPDSTPTVALTNAAGTDRSGRLSTFSNPSTGVYTLDYTATAGDAEEQLLWVFTVVEATLTRTYTATSVVVEYTQFRFSSTDRTALNAINTKIGTPVSTVSADIAVVNAKTTNLPANPAAVGSAMTLASASITSAVINDGALTDAKFTFPGEASGRPTTFLASMRRVFEWMCNKRNRDRSSGIMTVRNAADSADLEAQTQSSSGGPTGVDTISKGA